MAGSTNDTPELQAEKQTIGSEIIKARELLGLTQAELATRSQVSLSAIKGYETGRNFPGAREIKQLCQVLRISPNRLIFGDENPFPERTWHHKMESTSAEPIDYKTRLEFLLPLLSSSECAAFYQLANALATARHGVKATVERRRSAEAESGINLFVATGKFEATLHGKLLVDTEVARKYAASILTAADETDKVNRGDPT
ncbi:helix-turn-helix protein [Acidovorax sp. 107]|jgi:transcriptional regulator with XRE-family HTH domain|uniref:helix-turn-helix domain-containing protein n=1 Tax=Acidovorax sp. 107 TaxID=2135638 RepID=UPI000D368ACD|nr:helix-turn-helix transcriptional regulator [Acidovorax sp. 107]PUA98535.1 helix-turn-helix protein [Acidovorax sp. 107]